MKDNVPLSEDANRNLLRAHIRVGKVGPFINRLREIFGRIEKELWPEDESRQEMETLLGRLGRFRPECNLGRNRQRVAVLMWRCPWSESIAKKCGKIS